MKGRLQNYSLRRDLLSFGDALLGLLWVQGLLRRLSFSIVGGKGVEVGGLGGCSAVLARHLTLGDGLFVVLLLLIT